MNLSLLSWKYRKSPEEWESYELFLTNAAHARISSYASDMITSFQSYWQCKGFLVWWLCDEIKGKKSGRNWIQVKSLFWVSLKWAIKINKIFVISRIFETSLLAMVMVKFTWQKGLLSGIYCPLQNPWISTWGQKFCCWSWCNSRRVSFPPHQKANQEVGLGRRPYGSLLVLCGAGSTTATQHEGTTAIALQGGHLMLLLWGKDIRVSKDEANLRRLLR